MTIAKFFDAVSFVVGIALVYVLYTNIFEFHPNAVDFYSLMNPYSNEFTFSLLITMAGGLFLAAVFTFNDTLPEMRFPVIEMVIEVVFIVAGFSVVYLATITKLYVYVHASFSLLIILYLLLTPRMLLLSLKCYQKKKLITYLFRQC